LVNRLPLRGALAPLAAGATATIVFNNQCQFNGAATKLRMLEDRHPGEAHPGTNAVARYFKIEDECAQAVRLKVLAASGGLPQ
jgi:metallo-beta-lactamase class B